MASLEIILTQYGLDDIGNKLQSARISIDTLKWMDITKDFDEFVEELSLNIIQKIKLRAVINELQSKHTLFFNEKYKKINRISIGLENEINVKFQEIISKLQNRQNQLLLDIQQWKLQQIKNNNQDSTLYEPNIDVSSAINLHEISSFINIQFTNNNKNDFDKEESKEFNSFSKIQTRVQLNPFCADYVEIKQIDLEYFDHRKHFINDDTDNTNQYHPKNLLDLYSNDKYYSDKICNFQMDKNNKIENDWIIFKILYEKQYFIPTICEIKNHSNEYAVKILCLYIGNKKGVWFQLNKNNVILSNNNIFSQKINLNLMDNINKQLIIDKNLNCFKVELIENYGANSVDKSKFCLHYLALHGKTIK